MIGVSVQPVPREALEEFGLKERTGAVVAVVTPKGPAANAGMEPGDVILEVNNRPIASRDELVQTVMALTPGTTVPVTVLRDKQRKTLNVTIGEINLDQESGQRGRRGQPGRGHHGRLRHVAWRPHRRTRPSAWACPPAPTARW